MPQVRRGGRPSRAASEQLGERILDAATQMFLALGFGATSIDALAQQLRMSKRTFYHRFPNKEALFAAVVHRIIQRLRPPPDIPQVEVADDELVEVTPQSIRIRKRHLKEHERKKASREAA